MTTDIEKKQIIGIITFPTPVILFEGTRIEVVLRNSQSDIMVVVAIKYVPPEDTPKMLTDINFYGYKLPKERPDEAPYSISARQEIKNMKELPLTGPDGLLTWESLLRILDENDLSKSSDEDKYDSRYKGYPLRFLRQLDVVIKAQHQVDQAHEAEAVKSERERVLAEVHPLLPRRL